MEMDNREPDYKARRSFFYIYFFFFKKKIAEIGDVPGKTAVRGFANAAWLDGQVAEAMAHTTLNKMKKQNAGMPESVRIA
ncbi:hypothetical protein AB7A76_20305 [Klebsiella pneumoniae]